MGNERYLRDYDLERLKEAMKGHKNDLKFTGPKTVDEIIKEMNDQFKIIVGDDNGK